MSTVLNEELLDLPYINDEAFNTSVYTYDYYLVPRVTHIINACKDQSGLIEWASNITREKYDSIRDMALSVGTVVHELIDNFLLFQVGKSDKRDRYPMNFANTFPEEYKRNVFIAYKGFRNWYESFIQNGYMISDVKAIELPLVCGLYGGTADAIIEINNQYTYLVDFKTSKSISSEYFLQLAAYTIIINNHLDPNCTINHVDGIGVIRSGKFSSKDYEDLFMTINNPDYRYFEQCFLSMVETYYRLISSNKIYELYNSSYNVSNVFRR